MTRRKSGFATPWQVVETESAFVVKDASGSILATIAFDDVSVSGGKAMTKSEARGIAENMLRSAEILPLPPNSGGV